MHRLLLVALAATACAATPAIDSIVEKVDAEEAFTNDSTTLESNVVNDDTADDINSHSEIPRMRRIYGPDATEVSEAEYNRTYPFVVSIYDKDNNFVCTGSVLTRRLILTARHCVKPMPVAFIRANSRDSIHGGELHNVSQAILYAYPKGPSLEHDIALLPLRTPIVDFHPVRLVTRDISVPNKKKVTALGWGRQPHKPGTKTDYPQYLWKVDIATVPVKTCLDTYQSWNWICTSSRPSSTCQGDSGGPLMYQGVQVGVTSHGERRKNKMCGNGVPTANVKLKAYLEWINDYITDPLYS
ncbi:hypothetical protein QAD02_010587 [Eretmocerus hayati]|uniref:Uncharacterized protein n=1 Tax=Eretmocerus hayati TaxID=131215 RepID=A0ACC2NW25_9HYME|nr:hypothetical protein QAD02_010587 [Eretmocerus hayati]